MAALSNSHLPRNATGALPTVVWSLIQELFKPEFARLNRALADLNTRNKELKHLTFDGFLFDGRLYLPREAKVILTPGTPSPTLSQELEREMLAFTKDRKAVNDDKQMISQALHNATEDCFTYQEVRDALPECLVPLAGELKSLERLNPVAYTLVDKPLQYRQFMKILPKMELYSACRLIY